MNKTPIEWCDSTVNPVMGCDGCELWTPPDGGDKHCYAGVLHLRHGMGRSKGYAHSFLVPEIFPGRMAHAATWKDLTGTKRPAKPWLDGRPRHVFISDMGDALSASVGFEFLYSEVVSTARSWPHVGMWLTKQPQRMVEFYRWICEQYDRSRTADGRTADPFEWPERLWVGASLTDPRRQRARVDALRQVPATRFLSVEPLIAEPGTIDLSRISLCIIGSESGPRARPMETEWAASIVCQCRAAGVACFVKQIANAKDRKGGDPAHWPPGDWPREFPEARP